MKRTTMWMSVAAVAVWLALPARAALVTKTYVDTTFLTVTNRTLVRIAASNSSVSAKAIANYICSGANDEVAIQVALNANPLSQFVLLEGTYRLAGAIKPTNVVLNGMSQNTVIDCSLAETNGASAFVCGDNVELSSLKIVGAVDPGTEVAAIACGSSNLLTRIWIDRCWKGIEAIAVTNVTIRDYKATNLRGINGWANAINAGAASKNISCSRIVVDSCDRGIENEDGTEDCYYESGRLSNVFPLVAYTYGFSLDAHGHDANTNATKNIHFHDFKLYNCVGLTVSGGADPAYFPFGVVYDGITIETPITNLPCMTIGGRRTRLNNVTLSGATNGFTAVLVGEDTVFDNLLVTNTGKFTLSTTATTSKLAFLNSTFACTNINRYAVESVSATTNLVFKGCTFRNVGTYGGLFIGAPAQYPCVEDNLFIMSTTSPGGYAARISGKNPIFSRNIIVGVPTTQAADFGADGSTHGALVEGNRSVSGSFWLRSACTNCVVNFNYTGSGMQDDGATNKWFRNYPATLDN